MSNDTSFELRFVCPSRELLNDVLTYLRRKKERWDAWKQRGKTSSELLERVGAENVGAVVSWGFDYGEVQLDDDGEASVDVTSWANQNLGNVHISGARGELADLIKKFPFLDISGSYESEYDSGTICGWDEC